MSGSPRFLLSKADWIKIGKGLGLALAGAGLTWAAAELIPRLEQSNEPTLLFLAAVLGAAINVVRKWVTDTR